VQAPSTGDLSLFKGRKLKPPEMSCMATYFSHKIDKLILSNAGTNIQKHLGRPLGDEGQG
jgi:hypothetical protein